MRGRVINMDISNFMTWFINQVINMFTEIFNTLDSFKFLGTSLLGVIVTIVVLIPLLNIVLTISKSTNFIGSKSEQVKKSKERSNDNE